MTQTECNITCVVSKWTTWGVTAVVTLIQQGSEQREHGGEMNQSYWREVMPVQQENEEKASPVNSNAYIMPPHSCLRFIW